MYFFCPLHNYHFKQFKWYYKLNPNRLQEPLLFNMKPCHDAVPWWEQEADSGNIGQSKSWKTCRMCPVSE